VQFDSHWVALFCLSKVPELVDTALLILQVVPPTTVTPLFHATSAPKPPYEYNAEETGDFPSLVPPCRYAYVLLDRLGQVHASPSFSYCNLL
jgi:hypothetical protein